MRLRKTDTLLAIGLVVILLWTPAFVAQGEEARQHAAEKSFTLPPLREGTRISYDLVVQVGGKDAEVFTGFASVLFRHATPSEMAEGAVSVQERVYRNIDQEFHLTDAASFRIDQAPHALRLGHGRDGLPAVAWESGSEQDEKAARYDLFYRPWSDENVVMPGTTVKYTPDPISAFTHDTTASVRAFFVENHDFPDPTATVVAAYGDRTLYGQTRPLSDLWEFGEPYRGFDGIGLTPWPMWLYDENHDEEHRLESTGEETWFAEDLPVPAGYHWKVRLQGGGEHATIDIVPGQVHQGTGAVLDMRPSHNPRAWERDIATATDLLPIGDLMHDDRPLVGSVSLAWLTQQVLDSGPAEVIAALDQGAFLAAFEWEESMPPPENVTSLLPPILGNKPIVRAPEATRVAAEQPVMISEWHLDFALGDKRWLVHADVVEGDGLDVELSLDEICPRPMRTSLKTCDAQDPNDLVADPHALLDQARSAGMTARPGANVSFTFTPSHDGLVRPPYLWNAPLSLIQGKVAAYQRDENGTHHMAWSPKTGVLAYDYRSQTGGPAKEPPLPLATATKTLETEHAVGYTAAGAGLLIAVAGALPRLLAWLRFGTGGMLLAGLYAKIAKSEVLEHERREEIVTAVEHHPGLRSSDISKRFGYGWGATLHHLGTLERNGLLSSMTFPGGRYWFVAAVPPQERLRSIAVRHGPSARLLEEIGAHPGATLTEIVENAGLSKSVGSKAGKRLEVLGLVEKRREGRTTRYFAVS